MIWWEGRNPPLTPPGKNRAFQESFDNLTAFEYSAISLSGEENVTSRFYAEPPANTKSTPLPGDQNPRREALSRDNSTNQPSDRGGMMNSRKENNKITKNRRVEEGGIVSVFRRVVPAINLPVRNTLLPGFMQNRQPI